MAVASGAASTEANPLMPHAQGIKAGSLRSSFVRAVGMGKPIRSMRRFLRKVAPAPGTRCALLSTELAPRPDRKTGRLPTEEERARWQRVVPVMQEILEGKGLEVVATGTILVDDIEGPLEDGWEEKVATFASTLSGPL